MSIVYIYDKDLPSAQEYQKFLSGFDYEVVLLKKPDISEYDFSKHDGVIVGNDGMWLTEEAGNLVEAVEQSGKPIIGIGEGGYDFFGVLELEIGARNGWHGSLDSVYVLKDDLSIYKSPNKLEIPEDKVLKLFSSSKHVGIYFKDKSFGEVEVLGRELNSESHFPLVQKGRYLLWGFTAGPGLMTDNGKLLFQNVLENTFR